MTMDTDWEIIKAAEPAEGLVDYVIEDPYRRWQVRENVKVINEYAFDDLNEVELGPWERKGGSGAIINSRIRC